jgi:hypothetical protein
VIFLQQTVDIIDNIAILGTTGWTEIPEAAREAVGAQMNDYRTIYKSKDELVTPEHTSNLHKTQTSWLRDSLVKLETDDTIHYIIVMTHHAPSFKMLAPTPDSLNCAYATDLEELIKSSRKLRYWINGHTHLSMNATVGETTIISNCLGYRLPHCSEVTMQETGYDKNRTITLKE